MKANQRIPKSMTVNAHIVAVEPHTVYEDTVYEQRVVLDVDGCVFGVFDNDLLVDPDAVGEYRTVNIRPFLPTDVSVDGVLKPGVYPNEHEPRGYDGHRFCGEVVDCSSGWPREVTLDIGAGTVSVKFYEDTPDHIQYQGLIEELENESLICVITSRTDLHDIEEVD